ncbi:DUF4305 domain-containing protein [Salicibibacter halophilus]|uniref:DUF4305 domain-containing protein n=1 Tax=Salicibibacter halophilus TaxID=2502791 RepID=A0A514LL10_9BACI|nr:DUF4305 domain-containing protein [Salicibibacter halophilus]
MMRSPGFLSFVYVAIGTLFVLFAIMQVQLEGWGFLPIFFLALAALDYVIAWHFVKKTRGAQNHNK